MLFSAVALVLAAHLLPFARADDDGGVKAGVTYFIQNVITGYVFHNPPNKPGNAIVGLPINGAEPDPQLFTLQLVRKGEDDDSGSVYTFSASSTGSSGTSSMHLFTTGLPGSALVSQNYKSQFLITPIDDLDGLYTISSPTESFAVTASTTSGEQLTLQPLNPVSPFQQWAFVAFGDVPGGDDDDD